MRQHECRASPLQPMLMLGTAVSSEAPHHVAAHQQCKDRRPCSNPPATIHRHHAQEEGRHTSTPAIQHVPAHQLQASFSLQHTSTARGSSTAALQLWRTLHLTARAECKLTVTVPTKIVVEVFYQLQEPGSATLHSRPLQINFPLMHAGSHLLLIVLQSLYSTLGRLSHNPPLAS